VPVAVQVGVGIGERHPAEPVDLQVDEAGHGQAVRPGRLDPHRIDRAGVAVDHDVAGHDDVVDQRGGDPEAVRGDHGRRR
jgi:hypothetical protein